MLRTSELHTQEDQSSGLLQTMSRASGWLNPFSYLRTPASKTIVTAITLNELVGSANAQACFSINSAIYQVSCISSVEDGIVSLLKSQCGYALTNPGCFSRGSIWSAILTQTERFGSTVFGFNVCGVTYNILTQQAPACMVDVMKHNVKNHVYGGVGDILVTVGIAAAGALTLTGAVTLGLCLFNRKKSPAVTETSALLDQNANSSELKKLNINK
jgi:hypothetical protein